MRKLNDLERAILSMCRSQQRRLEPAFEEAGMTQASRTKATSLKEEINIGVKTVHHLEQIDEKASLDKELKRLKDNIRQFQELLGLMKEQK